MRVLKFIGFVLLFVVVVALVLPLIMPDHAETSQHIRIKANAQTAFRQVNSLKNWRNWSPFELGDTNMISTYEGPEQGVGSKHVWTSKTMGDGSMAIVKSEPYNLIQSELDFGSNGKAMDEWNFTPVGDSVDVTWKLSVSELSYPFGKYFGFFLESLMKPMQEKGLQKLREVVEAIPESTPIIELEIDPQPSLTVFDSVKINDMGPFMEKSLQSLGKYLNRHKIEIIAPVFTMYYNWDPDGYIKMRPGFPVLGEQKESGNIEYYVRPGGKVVVATFKGPYEQIGKAHEDIDAYLRDFDLETAELPIFEEYVVGIDTEPDPQKWITKVYYYVK